MILNMLQTLFSTMNCYYIILTSNHDTKHVTDTFLYNELLLHCNSYQALTLMVAHLPLTGTVYKPLGSRTWPVLTFKCLWGLSVNPLDHLESACNIKYILIHPCLQEKYKWKWMHGLLLTMLTLFIFETTIYMWPPITCSALLPDFPFLEPVLVLIQEMVPTDNAQVICERKKNNICWLFCLELQ